MKHIKIEVYLTSFTVFFSGDIKKNKKSSKKKKKNSENDQLTGIFSEIFFIFFRTPDPKSEKNSRESTIKKDLALLTFLLVSVKKVFHRIVWN